MSDGRILFLRQEDFENVYRRLDELTERVKKLEVGHVDKDYCCNHPPCEEVHNEECCKHREQNEPCPAPSAPSGEERCSWCAKSTDHVSGKHRCTFKPYCDLDHARFPDPCDMGHDPTPQCHPFVAAATISEANTPPATAREGLSRPDSDDISAADVALARSVVDGLYLDSNTPCAMNTAPAKAESGKDERRWFLKDGRVQSDMGQVQPLDSEVVVPLAAAVAEERERTMRECADHGCMWCRERLKP